MDNAKPPTTAKTNWAKNAVCRESLRLVADAKSIIDPIFCKAPRLEKHILEASHKAERHPQKQTFRAAETHVNPRSALATTGTKSAAEWQE